MATMVLSSLGAAVAGPFGGAVGALIGNGLDRQLLGSRSSRPKHGDLAVQSSTYGNPVPQVFGRMRIAGTVIWASPIRDNPSQSVSNSITDNPQAPNYSASFAVALSSRRAERVGRIWADSNLIRDEDGSSDLPWTMRFHDGDEDQLLDPLIASAEGLEYTPAYRGTAILVFEDFPLAPFGNRIPSLTFEIEADPGPVRVGTVLEAVSRKVIADGGSGHHVIDGYAAYGETIRDAMEPLIQAYAVDFVDRSSALTCYSSPTRFSLNEQELGAQEGVPALKVGKAYRAERELPKSVLLNYYDVERSYQGGVKRADAGAGSRTMLLDLPAVMSASAARQVTEDRLCREWKAREQVRISLPLSRLSIQPGDEIRLPGGGAIFRVAESRIEAFSTYLELEPCGSTPSSLLPAESGRLGQEVPGSSRPLELMLFEAPLDGSGNELVVYLAAAGGSHTQRARPLELVLGSETITVLPKREEAILGRAVTLAGPKTSALIDRSSSIEVQLSDPRKWLESRDDLSLVNGANLALLGEELIQFGIAEPLGSGRFKLRHLLRGRKGTEWAMSTHKGGERFVLIDPGSISALKLGIESLNATLAVKSDPAVSLMITGESLRSPGPVRLNAVPSADGLDLTWVGRKSDDWNWLSEVDLSSTHIDERFRVTLSGEKGSLTRTVIGCCTRFSNTELIACGKLVKVEVASLSKTLPSHSSQLNIS